MEEETQSALSKPKYSLFYGSWSSIWPGTTPSSTRKMEIGDWWGISVWKIHFLPWPSLMQLHRATPDIHQFLHLLVNNKNRETMILNGSQWIATNPLGQMMILKNLGNKTLKEVSPSHKSVQKVIRCPFPILNLARASTFSQVLEILTQGLCKLLPFFSGCMPIKGPFTMFAADDLMSSSSIKHQPHLARRAKFFPFRPPKPRPHQCSCWQLAILPNG